MDDFAKLKLFCQEHDFTYFDSLSERTKTLFQEEIKKLKKTPISTIIKNHLTYTPKDFPTIGRVQGPASVYKLIVQGKIIYLFGDIHSGSSICPVQNVPDFTPLLKKHMKKSDKIIDLFIEKTHSIGSVPDIIRERPKKTRGFFWQNVWTKGVASLYASTGSPILNVRVHDANIAGVDIRMDTNRCLDRFITYGSSRGTEGLDVLKDCLKHLRKKLSKENETTFSASAVVVHIKKQISGISNTDIKKFLSQLLDKTCKEYIDEVRNLQSILKREKEITTSGLVDIGNCLLKLAKLSFLELYFIGRIFREFSIVKGKIPKDTPKYIVGYFGDEHIRYIVNVLKNEPFYGIIEKEIPKNEKEDRCLDLNIVGPMF
jgi:hypothetical protein